MEIRGELKSIHPDRLTVIANEKDQEIDVFYTPTRLTEVKILVVRERVIFETILQQVDVGGEKLGKFWLNHILHPRPPLPKKRGKGESDRDWAEGKQSQ